MYESAFGLSDRPFAAAPSARRYFAASAIDAARQTLARCIDRAEGAGIVVGPAGTGKSLLCQVLAEQFRNRFFVALLASGRLETRRALLQAILFELKLPYRCMDEGELRLSLVDYLTAQEIKNAGLLLVIDEAHGLPLRLLEEIHQLTNLVRGGQPRVRVVLSGGAALEEHLGCSKLESFNQRVAARCYLQAFNHTETLGYVRHAISQVGGDADRLFTGDAFDAVHRVTDGVPRLVNQLCDHALLLACAAGVKPLTAAGIEEAWADLQQLPTRWNAAPGVESASADIIEFGSLDEPVVAARIAPETEPRLHAVADDEALFSGEPTQRIQRIKDRLGTIDEQFQADGTTGPEVELVFSQAEINPFDESFEEEELIVDRFIGSRTGPLADAPVVRSAEGAEISQLPPPHARDTKSQKRLPNASRMINDQHPVDERISTVPIDPLQNTPIIASIDQPIEIISIEHNRTSQLNPSSIDELADDDIWQDPPALDLPGGMIPVDRGWIHPSQDPVMPEEPVQVNSVSPAAEIKPTIPMPRDPATIRGKAPAIKSAFDRDAVMPPTTAAEINVIPTAVDGAPDKVAEISAAENLAIHGSDASDADETDVIIVEDDPVPPPTAASAVRRQEYRQLFARLRRG